MESLSHRITTPVMPDDEPLDFPETCCYTVENQEPKSDLWVLPLQGDRKPAPFLRTEFNESYTVSFLPPGIGSRTHRTSPAAMRFTSESSPPALLNDLGSD